MEKVEHPSTDYMIHLWKSANVFLCASYKMPDANYGNSHQFLVEAEKLREELFVRSKFVEAVILRF